MNLEPWWPLEWTDPSIDKSPKVVPNPGLDVAYTLEHPTVVRVAITNGRAYFYGMVRSEIGLPSRFNEVLAIDSISPIAIRCALIELATREVSHDQA